MAKKDGQERPRIAVDTNYILDCYDEDEASVSAWETLMERLSKPTWIIPPTAGQELLFLAKNAETKAAAERFQKAAIEAVEKWGFKPVDMVSVNHGIAERVADELRRLGVIPEEEVNDSLIVAESSRLSCPILVTSDKELVGANSHDLNWVLDKFDCERVAIYHPMTIIKTWRGAKTKNRF